MIYVLCAVRDETTGPIGAFSTLELAQWALVTVDNTIQWTAAKLASPNGATALDMWVGRGKEEWAIFAFSVDALITSYMH